MLIKNNFSLNSKQLKQNIKKTKKIFESFKLDFKDSKFHFFIVMKKTMRLIFQKILQYGLQRETIVVEVLQSLKF